MNFKCAWLRWILLSLVMGLLSCGDDSGSKAEGGSGREGAESPRPVVKEGVAVVPSHGNELELLDDPSTDGWSTEVLHEKLKKHLGALAVRVESGELDRAFLSDLLSPEFAGTDLLPKKRTEVFGEGGIRVVRGEPSPVATRSGMEGFLEALVALRAGLAAEASTVRCKFKVVQIDRAEGEVRSSQLMECVAEGEAGVTETHSEWSCAWSLGGSGKIALRSVRLARFEQSSLPGRLFTDCTESLFSKCRSYHSQLLYGANHWLPRIQDTRQMTLLGAPGVALGDINGDGLDDLYLCQPGGLPNRMFLQKPDGSLQDVTDHSGTGWVESSRGALLVDLDNDGGQDLVVALYGRVAVARNEGDGRFEVVAILDAGVGVMGISAADYDDDGDLDLYICHYSKGDLEVDTGATVIGAGGFVYHDANNGGRNYLYRNEQSAGASWSFRDVTEECGLDQNNRRFSFAAAWEDFDRDGDEDLYVANDFGRNNFYRNEGGRFVDVAAQIGGEDRASGMSVSWGDVNRDGRMDLYVGNMFSAAGNRIVPQSGFSPTSTPDERSALLRFARGNTLLQQSADGFADVSEDLGVTMGRWAWSSLFADLNNDGWEDLLVANGYITTPDTGDL